MSKVKVAVYGTLKEGYGNHRVLGDEAKFLYRGMTTRKYDMKNAGFPAIMPNPEGKPVAVEVYEVPETQLPYLDRLEGTPHMYTRETEDILVFLNMEEEDVLEDVFIYVGTENSFKRNPHYESRHEGYHEWEGYKRSLPEAGRFA